MNTPLKKARITLIITSVIMFISAINAIAGGFNVLPVIAFCAAAIYFRFSLIKYKTLRKKEEDEDN